MKWFAKMTWLMCLLLILSVTAACSAADVPEVPSDPDDNGQEDPAGPDEPGNELHWDESIETTIQIEGMDEPITLNLLETERFITYVPENMSTTVDGERVRVFAAFGGTPVEDAYLEIIFLPGLSAEPTLNELSDALDLDDFEINLSDPADHIHNWSVLEFYSHSHPEYSLSGALGVRDGQTFVALMHYPWEYGDGFEPRAKMILDYLHWTPSGEPLNP